MTTFTPLAPVPSDPPGPFTDQLRLAVAAYLAVQRLLPRAHRIRPPLLPCLVRGARPGPAGRPASASGALHPMDAGDPPVQASTVSRRFSVAAGFYRTCVQDDVLEHSLAEHVRRPCRMMLAASGCVV